ncbi:MAG: hypothetical protein HYV07_29095 [Deltaproteobacteria bacterium]|nr:hypothetical protein [Deltaproteobacteria bacterium]
MTSGPKARSQAVAELALEIPGCFDRAKRRWSSFLLLEPPIPDCSQPLAAIDLRTRRVVVNLESLVEKQLDHALEAILAHEIGHHVRYPGTLAVQARLLVLERQLIPFEDYSLVNLFTDLMINEQLGAELSGELAMIYRVYWDAGHTARRSSLEERWSFDPAFCLYLTIYEELWRLPRGSIVGAAAPWLDERFAGARSDAQLLASDLFILGPNLYTQFLFFVSVVARYVRGPDGQRPKALRPSDCSAGEPTTEDWADAMRADAKEQEAIDRALGARWFPEAQEERLREAHRVERRLRVLSDQPGRLERLPEVMGAHYRRQAERFLFRPPRQRALGEAIVPTTLTAFEPGDSVRDIDWLATLNARGPHLGAALPEKRERVAEAEGAEVSLWRPRIEIYLDVSGSMPDPKVAENAMTLAAQILAIAAIRSGGSARAILYSHEPVTYQGWARSELEISRFLMHYIGGGTEFPFADLDRSVREAGSDQPIRVVITDHDFDSNVSEQPGAERRLVEPVKRSARFVLLQLRSVPERLTAYRSIGIVPIPVEDMSDFPKMAARLARALFPEAGFAET